MTLFFISNLALFVVALGLGMNIGVVYFIWLGIFNFMVVSQFWAFANDVYTEDQGKRLFPVVGIGASAGALAGSVLTASVFERMSNASLMVLAGALLVVFILLIVWVNRRESAAGGEEARKAEQTLGKEDGFGLVVRNRYLLLIAMHVLILNLVNTVGEFIWAVSSHSTRWTLSAPEKRCARIGASTSEPCTARSSAGSTSPVWWSRRFSSRDS